MEETFVDYHKKFGNERCGICGKEFEKKYYNSRYCSDECKRRAVHKSTIDCQRRRYASDPEYRDRQRAHCRKYINKIRQKAKQENA